MREDYVTFGKEALRRGEIDAIINRFNLSYSHIAFAIGVNQTSLKAWCAGKKTPSAKTAARVGRWFDTVAWTLSEQGSKLCDLVHISQLTQQLALSHAVIIEKCRAGDFEAEHVDGLGWFIRWET